MTLVYYSTNHSQGSWVLRNFHGVALDGAGFCLKGLVGCELEEVQSRDCFRDLGFAR